MHNEFWAERPVLSHILAFARGRRVSPWATFGGVLTRVIAATEPHIQLPPIVGGYGSLNLFVGIVGRSGQGKGASQAAAAECINIRGGALFESISVGSGEGLAAAYVHRVKDDAGNAVTEQHAESALFDVAEIDTLTALAGRQGSTLLSELRKVWSGERLGFQNRDQARTLPVEAHTYRAALVVGIQPTRAGALLDDADGGTPQRFIWLPATDEDAPSRAPDTPAPMLWFAPTEFVVPTVGGKRSMGVAIDVWRTIDEAQVSRLRGDGHALDGHALFSRLKVSAGLALLDGRGDVTDDDWRLAGTVMAVSDATRAFCRDEIRRSSRELNRERAEARAEANVVTAISADDAALRMAKERVLGKVSHAWTSSASIRSDLSTRLRDYFDAAVTELVDFGVVEISRDVYQGRERVRLRLASPLADVVSPGDLPGLAPMAKNPRDSAVLSPDNASPGSHGGLPGLTGEEVF